MLTAEQEQALRGVICDKRPEQLKMDFALWSRVAVMQLIEREYGVSLSVRSVGKYLARWDFTRSVVHMSSPRRHCLRAAPSCLNTAR
ncbi:transposase [Azomonas macrocytogenes]|uniref:Transposase n=1 Tax=Azomonas macrocytogenes TaxID=69962 RepID=A0A839TAQ0_AZOMA|nr:transposase [Azomonas macrocytogenes]